MDPAAFGKMLTDRGFEPAGTKNNHGDAGQGTHSLENVNVFHRGALLLKCKLAYANCKYSTTWEVICQEKTKGKDWFFPISFSLLFLLFPL